MLLQPITRQSFVWFTVALNVLVFLGSDVAATYAGVYVAEFLATMGLMLQVVLIYRREAVIRWRWPWRTSYALALSLVTYLFLSSAYVPSPAPFEPEGMLKTEQVILRHYGIFLICLLPAVVSCGLTQSPSRKQQPISRAIVTPSS